MIEIFCNNSELKNLFEDYWKRDERGYFTYSQKVLLRKYSFNSYKELEKIIKNNGYIFINNKRCRCTECNEPRKLFFRRDIKDLFRSNNLICENCNVKKIEEELIEVYFSNIGFITNFKKIYVANFNNKYFPNYDDVMRDLNLLELIYLYVILKNNNIDNLGKLGVKKFRLFLHGEFYLENEILKKLYDKSLFFYNFDSSMRQKINTMKLFSGLYEGKLFSPLTEAINDIEETEFFNIILKPKNISFKVYDEYLLEKIEQYKLDIHEWMILSCFLKNIRKMEILFLNKVVNYNFNFNLLWDNGVDCKFEFLKESFGLKKIYGYFNSAVDSTLYKLDTLSDKKRKILKNRIYSNIFKSENEKMFFEKNLPGNYIKSKFLNFLEEKYELDCVWEDVPVNEFIRKLFEKFSELGIIVSP